jgi:hypothetical protein
MIQSTALSAMLVWFWTQGCQWPKGQDSLSKRAVTARAKVVAAGVWFSQTAANSCRAPQARPPSSAASILSIPSLMDRPYSPASPLILSAAESLCRNRVMSGRDCSDLSLEAAMENSSIRMSHAACSLFVPNKIPRFSLNVKLFRKGMIFRENYADSHRTGRVIPQSRFC